jgi:hypothetical protein
VLYRILIATAPRSYRTSTNRLPPTTCNKTNWTAPRSIAITTQTKNMTTIVENGSAATSSRRYSSPGYSQECADSNSSLVPQINSPFLRLPAEIRNMVYAYALGGNTWSIKTTQDVAGTAQVRADNGIKNALALLRVNRQIHAEACLFPYLYNTFAGVHNGHLYAWVKSLTYAERTCIRAIKRYQRGYVVRGLKDQSLTINPAFWMDVPRIVNWGLDGLERIEVEVALRKWGWDSDKEEIKRVVDEALVKLRTLVEVEHPGVEVDVFMRHGY